MDKARERAVTFHAGILSSIVLTRKSLWYIRYFPRLGFRDGHGKSIDAKVLNETWRYFFRRSLLPPFIYYGSKGTRWDGIRVKCRTRYQGVLMCYNWKREDIDDSYVLSSLLMWICYRVDVWFCIFSSIRFGWRHGVVRDNVITSTSYNLYYACSLLRPDIPSAIVTALYRLSIRVKCYRTWATYKHFTNFPYCHKNLYNLLYVLAH